MKTTRQLLEEAVHKHKAINCPGCGAHLTASVGINHEAAPQAGDTAICGHCRSVLQFEEGGTLKLVRKALQALQG